MLSFCLGCIIIVLSSWSNFLKNDFLKRFSFCNFFKTSLQKGGDNMQAKKTKKAAPKKAVKKVVKKAAPKKAAKKVVKKVVKKAAVKKAAPKKVAKKAVKKVAKKK